MPLAYGNISENSNKAFVTTTCFIGVYLRHLALCTSAQSHLNSLQCCYLVTKIRQAVVADGFRELSEFFFQHICTHPKSEAFYGDKL